MKTKNTFSLTQTDMIILSLLEKKDLYGYEIIELLGEKSDGLFDMKAGTLYPLLHGLENNGYVKSYNSNTSLGKTRKYYSITKMGEGFLHEKKEYWKEYVGTINNIVFNNWVFKVYQPIP